MYHTYPTVVLLSMPTKHTLLPVFSDSSPFLVVMSHTYERHMWLTLSFSPYIQSSPLANLTSYLPHTPDSDQLLLSSQLLSPLTWTMARSHLRAPCPFWEPPIQHMEGCFWTVDQLMPFLVQPSSAFLHTWNKIHSSLHGPWRLPPLTHCCCASPMPINISHKCFISSALFWSCCTVCLSHSSTYSGGSDLTPGFPLLPCCRLCRALSEFQSLSSPCPCNSLLSP